jgi:Skp family chaperone for outer membrane proteins
MMLLGFVNRLLRITPEKQLIKLNKLYAEREEELRELELEILALEAELKSH